MCKPRCSTNNSRGLLPPPSQAHISSNDLTTTPTSTSQSPQATSISNMPSPSQEVVPVQVIKTKKRVSWKESVRCTFIKGCTKDTWYDEDDYDQFHNDVFDTIDQYNMIKSNKRRGGAAPRRSSMSLLLSTNNTRRNAFTKAAAATNNDAASYKDEKVCIRGLEHFADKACRKAKRQARVTAWLTVLDLQDEQWEAQIAAVAAAAAALDCKTVEEEEESETDGYNSSASSNDSLSMMMDMTMDMTVSTVTSPRCVEDFPINNYNDPETRRRILEANAEALAKAYEKVTKCATQEAFLRGLQDQVAAC